MTLVETWMYYKTAVFYYILGGVTFIPICLVILVGHFLLTAPPFEGLNHQKRSGDGGRDGSKSGSAIDDGIGEGELSEERKRQALSLAAWNHDAQAETKSFEEKQGEDASLGDTDSSIPTAAKRVKPAPQPPRKPHLSGWLTVRRHFQNEGVNLALQQAAQQAAKRNTGANGTSANGDQKNAGYMSMMYRGMLNYRGAKNGDGTKRTEDGIRTPNQDNAGETSNDESEGASGPNTPSQSNGAAQSSSVPAQVSAAKETFHCILKGPILYLYTSADPASPDTECVAAIDVRQKRVSLFVNGCGDTMGEPDDSSSAPSEKGESADESNEEAVAHGDPGLRMRKTLQQKSIREGELFVKRNAIRIVSVGTSTNRVGAKGKSKYAQWFIFAKNAYLLEDWYHALFQASTMPEGSEEGPDLIAPVFEKDDMANLLGTLDSVPDPIPLRWLNAMVGRVFFSIYRTSWLEDYITNKIRLKMSRVRTPSYLSDIRVREIDLGSTAPAFSRPMLKSLTGDGEASMEVDMHYTGSVRLTISTVLTISLGQRFKQYSVTLVLAVILNSLEGNLLLQIKPPPSNRIWFGFTKLPKMDISVEPVVSERKVQWSMVKRIIEGRIRELLVESIVVPNMDDIPFFDTRKTDHRGGIWAEAAKKAHQVDLQSTAQKEDEVISPPEADPAAASSQSKSTPASVIGVPVGDDQATSSAIATPDTLPQGVRSRRPIGTLESANGSDPSLLSTSPAAAGLTALLARDQAANRTGSTSSSSTMLSTWGKAKASMADRDSRHAAAREAKDAMKRGWANWSTRRQGGSRASTINEERSDGLAAISTSSDRLGEASSAPTTTDNARAHRKQPPSSWMASSPEDPASLGTGIEVRGLTSSPSLLSLDATQDDERDGHTSSRASSISGRKPYRQLRAEKAKRDIDSPSQTSSRASSIHSVERTPSPPPPIPMRPDLLMTTPTAERAMEAGLPQDVVRPSVAWDALAPGLTTPLPAAQKEQKNDATGEHNTLSTSPSSTVRRTTMRPSVQQASASVSTADFSSSPEHAKSAYSFSPGQSLAVTGLSGNVDLPSLSGPEFPATPTRQQLRLSGEVQRNDSSGLAAQIDEGSPSQRRASLVESAAEITDDPFETPSPKQSAPSTLPPIPPPIQPGIKQQPTRAPMMAVPGIPSMQKAGPQSFEAPVPPPLPARAKSTSTVTSGGKANQDEPNKIVEEETAEQKKA